MARDGRAVPLVASERGLAGAGRQAPAVAGEHSPARRALLHLLLGLLVGGVLIAASVLWRPGREGARGAGDEGEYEGGGEPRRDDGREVEPESGGGAGRDGGRRSRAVRTAARWVLAVIGSLWGLLAGVLGLVLLGLWTLTDHEFAWNNENLLQANPLALALVVLVPLAVARGGAWSGWATKVAGVVVVLSLCGLVLHPLPVTPQANLAIIGLALPIHAGAWWALRRLQASEIPSPERAGR